MIVQDAVQEEHETTDHGLAQRSLGNSYAANHAYSVKRRETARQPWHFNVNETQAEQDVEPGAKLSRASFLSGLHVCSRKKRRRMRGVCSVPHQLEKMAETPDQGGQHERACLCFAKSCLNFTSNHILQLYVHLITNYLYPVN